MIQLDIITPERTTFSEHVDWVSVPSVLGRLQILPRHMDFFAKLDEGELKIKTSSGIQYLAIGGGFVEVKESAVSILVTRAVYADELDEEQITKAQKDAREALAKGVSQEERLIAQQLFRRSMIDMRVLQRRKHKSIL